MFSYSPRDLSAGPSSGATPRALNGPRPAPSLLNGKPTGLGARLTLRQAASTSATKPDHIIITHATEAFLAKCVNRGIRPNTIAKYRTFTNQLKAWATDTGYVHVDQFTA